MDTTQKKSLHHETLALGLGYDACLSEGAIKPLVFMSSTFKFNNSETLNPAE